MRMGKSKSYFGGGGKRREAGLLDDCGGGGAEGEEKWEDVLNCTVQYPSYFGVAWKRRGLVGVGDEEEEFV